MLRLITISLLSTIVIGCGTGFRPVGYIDPEFRPLVEKFEQLAGVTVDVTMYFNELTGNIIGMCKTYSDGYKEIKIDNIWWNYSSDTDREILIFHELAHCVLGQKHRDYNLSDGCSGSVMDTYHIGSYCYNKHYDYYIGELF